MTSLEIFNGIGEHVLGFDQADPVADGAPWIARSWTMRDDEGRAVEVQRPSTFDALSGDPYVVANNAGPIPAAGSLLKTIYDPFGRPTDGYDGLLRTAHYTHLPLELRVQDAEQAKSSGPYAGLESSMKTDGHGRTVQTIAPVDNAEFTTTTTTYLGTGEPIQVDRQGSADPGHYYTRTLHWDSFGRLIHNSEPNTQGTKGGLHYVYDDESRLVGTSDGRGCGKNLYYDALGRILAEDFSPCLPSPEQAPYSTPDPVTGDGTEAFYRYDVYEDGQVAPTADFADNADLAIGQLVSVSDRGAHTRFNYDARGRTRRITKSIARPGVPADTLATRYASHVFKQEAHFDLGNRLRTRTTGLESTELTGGGSSFETMDYTARGAVNSIGSSYGPLITSMTYRPSGQAALVKYGDRAATQAQTYYDTRDRPEGSVVWRAAAPALWTTSPPPAGYSLPTADTTQLTLTALELTYDDVSNPKTINDVSTSYWPTGAKPVSRGFQYDPAYRVKQVTYSNLGDSDVPAFTPEARAGDRRPVAQVQGAARIQSQTFATDWQGNVTASGDNESLRFDRSLGTILNGAGADLVPHGPNQLIDADGIHASYDGSGNLVELTVARPTCWSAMPQCSHRFRYDWDEVGQMVRARRWDFAAGPVPAFDANVPPLWDLAYAYGGGARALTSSTDALGVPRHTLDVFDTLRISRVEFVDVSADYLVRPQDEVGFIGGVARVFFDRAGALPQAGNGSSVHVFLNVGDHRGSTAFVLDMDSGEVVERAAYQAYGALDADYRPDRWGASREEFKFTGKEEDIEVGVSYFGARYLNTRLGRWMSADPLTIHGLGSDLNPYAYVAGRVSSFTDPFGLDGGKTETTIVTACNPCRSTETPPLAADHGMNASRAEARAGSNSNWAPARRWRQLPVRTAAATSTRRAEPNGPDFKRWAGDLWLLGHASLRRPTFKRERVWTGEEPSLLEAVLSLEHYLYGEPVPKAVDLNTLLAGKRVDGVIPIGPGLGATRALRAADLGLSGRGLAKVAGSVVEAGGTRIISVDMVKAVEPGALLGELRGALPNIIDAARAQGVTTLQIEGSFANAGLRDFAAAQAAKYGGTFASSGGRETLTFLLRGQ